MEPRDVIPPVDVAKEPRELVAGPGPTIEPRWLDIDTAAQYLCMTRHALYHQVARLQLPFIRHGRLLRFDRVALDRWLEKEVLLADRLSRKTTGRHRVAGMARHYNHSEKFAADSLQIQPAEIICSVFGCRSGGCGLPPAKSRTTSGANSANIG